MVYFVYVGNGCGVRCNLHWNRDANARYVKILLGSSPPDAYICYPKLDKLDCMQVQLTYTSKITTMTCSLSLASLATTDSLICFICTNELVGS